MTGIARTASKFGVFVITMALLTAALFLMFGQYRSGSTNPYSAVFADTSRLREGDSVRIAGIRVGTVRSVKLQRDKTVVVEFDADREVVMTGGSFAAVRYLNLVGDRYLEIVEGPGSNRILPAGSRIPLHNTAPALDLDLLLGGLKPVLRGLKPQDVNALTSSLIQILQGQSGTVESLFSKSASFTNALAANNQVIRQLIDNLRTALSVINDNSRQFTQAVDSLEQLADGLAQDRDPIATAIDSLESGTASLADLLDQTRPPLGESVHQLSRLAPLLDHEKDQIDTAIQRAPENYRKLVRLGAYGSFYNYYICGIALRTTDLQGRTAQFPWFKNNGGRCGEP